MYIQIGREFLTVLLCLSVLQNTSVFANFLTDWFGSKFDMRVPEYYAFSGNDETGTYCNASLKAADGQIFSHRSRQIYIATNKVYQTSIAPIGTYGTGFDCALIIRAPYIGGAYYLFQFRNDISFTPRNIDSKLVNSTDAKMLYNNCNAFMYIARLNSDGQHIVIRSYCDGEFKAGLRTNVNSYMAPFNLANDTFLVRFRVINGATPSSGFDFSFTAYVPVLIDERNQTYCKSMGTKCDTTISSGFKGRCIPTPLVCNGFMDCIDDSDEDWNLRRCSSARWWLGKLSSLGAAGAAIVIIAAIASIVCFLCVCYCCCCGGKRQGATNQTVIIIKR